MEQQLADIYRSLAVQIRAQPPGAQEYGEQPLQGRKKKC